MRGELCQHDSLPLQPSVSLILVFPLLKAWIIFSVSNHSQKSNQCKGICLSPAANRSSLGKDCDQARGAGN